LDVNFSKLQEDKERLQSFYDNLENENRRLMSLKEVNFKLNEENERLRAHYEVLKEHELNIIKDYEAKLQKEQIISE
jgi:hypothetical protein